MTKIEKILRIERFACLNYGQFPAAWENSGPVMGRGLLWGGQDGWSEVGMKFARYGKQNAKAATRETLLAAGRGKEKWRDSL